MIASLTNNELVPTLTSDHVYLMILSLKPLDHEIGYYLVYSLRNELLHLQVTLCTQQHCFLGYLVLAEGVNSFIQ